MGRTWTTGRVAAEERGSRRLYARRISTKQRLYFAALLIVALALPLQAQSDIEFDPDITSEEFATFSRLVAQAIYATPVDPASGRGIFSFDVGVGATAMPIDTSASYWQKAVPDDFSVSDYVGVPRLIVVKGLSAATISASYAQVPDTDITVLGGALDVPIIDGGLVKPTLALRGAYARLDGVDQLDLTTYGVEVFLSKGFGPLTPYGAVGIARSKAEGEVTAPGPTGELVPVATFSDENEGTRVTVGLKLSLFIPKIIVEATQGEERSYAAKVSFGL